LPVPRSSVFPFAGYHMRTMSKASLRKNAPLVRWISHLLIAAGVVALVLAG